MSTTATARLLAHQLRYEQRTFWRNPASVFFVLGLPITLFVIFTTLNTEDVIAGRPFVDVFLAAMTVFGLVNATYGNLAAKIVLRREEGLLKRAHAAPLPLAVLLAAMLLSTVLVVAVSMLLLMAVAVIAYGAHLPQRPFQLAAVILVGAATFAALGILLASLIRRPEATDPIVYGTLLPVLFISGVFDQVEPGSLIAHIADLFPVSHILDAVLAATDGTELAADHLAVVMVWGAAATFLAARKFHWEPQANATLRTRRRANVRP